jgi:hypothetical protein
MTDSAPGGGLPFELAKVTDSLIHVGGDDLNALLTQFSDDSKQLRFVDGRLEATVNGLTVTVYELTLGPDGFDMRLCIGGREG